MSSDQPRVHVPTQEGYDKWSVIYDSDANPLIALEERITAPMLTRVEGKRIADIGCGTGRHAIRMAAQGALVTAVDFSAGMLEAARAKPGAEKVQWIQHDLSAILPLADGEFDRVVCALVFDHIEDVTALMRELGRICKFGGFVLVTVMHPAMMLKGVQARFTDPNGGVVTMPKSVPNQICDYVMGSIRAGLNIGAMSEHAADEKLIEVAPRAAKYLGWPLLLVMKLEKRG